MSMERNKKMAVKINLMAIAKDGTMPCACGLS
jgi:hypothetical protein